MLVEGGERRGGAVSRGGERAISQKKQEILFQAKIRVLPLVIFLRKMSALL